MNTPHHLAISGGVLQCPQRSARNKLHTIYAAGAIIDMPLTWIAADAYQTVSEAGVQIRLANVALFWPSDNSAMGDGSNLAINEGIAHSKVMVDTIRWSQQVHPACSLQGNY